VELGVGQQDGGGEVIGQSGLGQCLRLVVGEIRLADQLCKEVVEFEKSEFSGEFEGALAGRECGRDLQASCRGVEPVEKVVAEVDTWGDRDAVNVLEPVGDLTPDVARVHTHACVQLFGDDVECVNVVAALIEVIPHLFVGCGDRSAHGTVASFVGRRGELVDRDPVAAMKIHHGLRHVGVSRDHCRELLRVRCRRSRLDVVVEQRFP